MIQIQKKIIILIITVIMIFAAFSTINIVSSNVSGFNDTDDHWGKHIIIEAAGVGLIEGYPDGTFKPDGNIKREESIALLFRVYDDKIKTNAKCPFADVQGDEWFYDYVVSAYQEGLTEGTGENLFGVGTPITRQDMVTLIGRGMEKFNSAKFPETEEVKEINKDKFIDAEDISSYAEKYVAMLVKKGIIKGHPVDGGKFSFNSTEAITRAEACSIMFNVWKEVNKTMGSTETVENQTNPADVTKPTEPTDVTKPTEPTDSSDNRIREAFDQSDLVVRGTVEDVNISEDSLEVEYERNGNIEYTVYKCYKFLILIDYVYKGTLEKENLKLEIKQWYASEYRYADGSIAVADPLPPLYAKGGKAIFFLIEKEDWYEFYFPYVVVDEDWNVLW